MRGIRKFYKKKIPDSCISTDSLKKHTCITQIIININQINSRNICAK